MLMTRFKTSQAKKDSHSVDFDKNWLSELSSEEASSVVGGFQVVNDSGGTRRFYNFGANLVPQSQTLQPDQQGDYQGEYILYNTSQTGFEPALVKVDPTKTASFVLKGDAVSVDTDRKIFRAR